MNDLDEKLTNMPVTMLIDHINFTTQDEATRCRLLLAAVLLRLEAMKKEVR